MDDGWFIASPKPPPYEMPQARQTKDYLYNPHRSARARPARARALHVSRSPVYIMAGWTQPGLPGLCAPGTAPFRVAAAAAAFAAAAAIC